MTDPDPDPDPDDDTPRERRHAPEVYFPAMALGLSRDDAGRFLRSVIHQREIHWRRRVVWSSIGLVVLVLVYTLLYQWMLVTFEGVEVSVTDSLQVVIEAFTTAGFGGDTDHWNTHPMNLFVVFMNLTGVLLVFIALPLFVFPLLRETLADQPPETTDQTDHVVLCSQTQRQDALRRALDAGGVPYVVLDQDPDGVLALTEAGGHAIVGDPTTQASLRAANTTDARAVVADVSERRNLAVILAARELTEDATVVSIAEDVEDATYHRDAGADHVIRPSQGLGRSLGKKAGPSIAAELTAATEAMGGFPVTELLVTEDAEIAGTTLADSGLRARVGGPVIGIWTDGGFVPAPEPATRLDPYTILLVAGQPDPIPGVNARSIDPTPAGEDRIVVAGAGGIAEQVAAYLEEVDLPATVVDSVERSGVDVVGEITDRHTLEAAGVETARSVVLTVADDITAMYASVALTRSAPDTEVIVHARDPANLRQLYRAGAHYVLTLEGVTGRMLAGILIHGEAQPAPETQFRVRRTHAPALVGWSLAGVNIRARTGALVVGIERDGDLITRLPPTFVVREGDAVIVVGSADAIDAFVDLAH